MCRLPNQGCQSEVLAVPLIQLVVQQLA